MTNTPITFVYADARYDLAIPSNTPMVEILPAVVDEMGILSQQAASTGFSLHNELGEDIDMSLSPNDAHLAPGTLLTLTNITTTADSERYDDLVEVLGSVVESGAKPWTGQDALRTSLACAILLLIAISGMLWFQGGILAVTAGFGAALLGMIAAGVVLRLEQPVGAVALHLTAAVLAASGAAGLSDQAGVRILAAAVTLIVGSGLGFVTLRVFALPGAHLPELLALVGGMYAGLMLAWGSSAYLFFTDNLVLIGVVAVVVTALVMLLAAWIALANSPLRSYIPRSADERARDNEVFCEQDVRRHEATGRALVLGLKLAAPVVLFFAIPLVVNGSVASVVLIAAIGVALLLSTREVHDRREVLIGTLTGAGVLLELAVLTLQQHPQLVPVLVWLVVGAAAVVLMLGTLSRRFSATANRVADTLSVLALLTILPSAVITAGVV